MTPEQYDYWYASGRGRWIGETEFRLLASELDCQPGDKVLDVGCGTGWFTRRIANLPQHPAMTGVDIDDEALMYARGQDSKTCYLPGNAVHCDNRAVHGPIITPPIAMIGTAPQASIFHTLSNKKPISASSISSASRWHWSSQSTLLRKE